jgi:hypothetical protein
MGVDVADHRVLASWAADCAVRALPYFDAGHPDDGRPRGAVEAARAWARGELAVGEARVAAFAAHAAARAARDPAARAAARSAGHAAATAHVATHAAHAAGYAIVAMLRAAGVADPGATMAAERDWQHRHLPAHLWPVVWPAGDGS